MRIIVAIFFTLLSTSLCWAQSSSETTNSEMTEEERGLPVDVSAPTPVNPIKKRDKDEFVIAPIPFLNPSQGWGLALVGQYIFTMEDDSSPPSIVAGGAFYTEKHSYGGVLGYLGKLRNDHWRLGLLTGKATIFYNFYGIGYDENKKNFAIPIEQNISFVGLQVLYRVAERVFTGIQFLGAGLKTSISTSDPQYESAAAELSTESKFFAPIIKIQRDARNDTFYPTDGSLSNISAEFHQESWGDIDTYQIYKLDWNQYLKVADFDVLAYRVMTRLTYGNVPFYDLSSFGMQSDLRGFESGKYRDKMMWAGQGEWRHRFTDRWGSVAFAGLGEVAPSFSEFKYSKVLTSGGLGARFRIADKNPVDFRFDVAYGDKNVSYYFSVGQAF